MNSTNPDRLAISLISGTQVDGLIAYLVQENFNFTIINTIGGLLQGLEVCLLVGFERIRFQNLLELVRKDCLPYRHYVSTQGYLQGELANPSMVEAESGEERIYIMNLERFEQISVR
jgi:uncharacterized protein YaaQ